MDSSNPNPNKRPLDELYPEWPLSKRFKPEDLLDLLEEENESPTGEERELESVIKSFEEEIGGDGELGFLLHASDDELGLPPPCGSPEKPPPAADDVVKSVADVDGGFDSGVFGWSEEGLYGPLDLVTDLTWQQEMKAL